jgi:CO/xanthine dehydrogenase Mo-binding subunit
VIRMKTGARRDGTLTALQAELIGDAGAYASLSTKVLGRTTTHATGPYQVPNIKLDCFAMYTNNTPAGAFRGFGVPQSTFAAESNLEILAHELGMDPFAIRRKNALRVGSTTTTGQVLRESVGLLDCLDWVEARVKELGQSIGTPYPLLGGPADPGLKTARYSVPPLRGWGLACGYKNTGLGGGVDDASQAEVEVYPDGTVQVRTGAADLGQGLTTVLQQIAAEELGLPVERVRVLLSDTDLTPNGGPTTASRQTFITGNAVRLAAQGMRDQLSRVAAEQWDVPPDAIWFRNGEAGYSTPPLGGAAPEQRAPLAQVVAWLIAEGRQPRLTYHYHAPATQPLGAGGDMHFAFAYSAQAVQVAVDPATGKVQVLRVVAAADAGRALNPLAMRGQVEGGIVMGIGTTLTEEYKLEEGIPLTRRWKDYKAPLMTDMPEMDVHLAENPISSGPYGAKGVGELPIIPTAPAICNAIYHATGVRVTRLPVQPGELRRYASVPPLVG